MANIGLKYPVYKSGAKKGEIAKAIQADIKIDTNDVKLYANDAVTESDKSFKSGTLTLGIDDLPDEIQAEFLGHKLDTNGEIIASGNDISPYVQVGFYAKKRKNNKDYFRAIWLHKVQFGEPEDTNKTKGESVEFATTTLEGNILLDENNYWKSEQTFETEAEAKEYLDAKAGITPNTGE